jgi:hypothetical protein
MDFIDSLLESLEREFISVPMSACSCITSSAVPRIPAPL